MPSRAKSLDDVKQATPSWVVAIVLGLSLSTFVCHAAKPKLHLDTLEGPEGETKHPHRMCTADELLPQPSERNAVEWSHEHLAEPPYNCTCAQMRGRYICDGMGAKRYPKWIPQAVSNNSCHDITRTELMEAPFPPKYKVLVYGNSHLRQTIEAMICMFQGEVAQKKVVIRDSSDTNTEQIVSSDMQCRGCEDQKKRNEVSDVELALKSRGCMAETDTCRCTDDTGEFVFANEAELHFYYAGVDKNKKIGDALKHHGGLPFSDYDAVFANRGNPPAMTAESVLESALQIQNAGTQLFWLSTYEGGGDMKKWSNDDINRFAESGAKFFGVGDMVRGVSMWRKGSRQPQIAKNDVHFCMPGPPDEIALLLLKILWAFHRENELSLSP